LVEIQIRHTAIGAMGGAPHGRKQELATMQVLLSEAAYLRVSDRLTDISAELDVVTVDATGIFRRAGEPVDGTGVDPEIFWVSLDIFLSGMLPSFFARIRQGTRGKWAQMFFAGLDSPVLTEFIAQGIRITKNGAQSQAIAEYVICHALSLLHPIAEQCRAQQAHEWKRINFREIGDTRWLLVGLGAVGTEIARRLQPFGAHLTVFRRNNTPTPFAADTRPASDLIHYLPHADVVVLACALNEETRGIAGAEFFKAIKKGSLFINIARGGLVDEAALKAGLERDQPALAVLDVFATEPLPADSWLWEHPKVTVTAHCSNAGSGVVERGDDLFLDNLRSYCSDEPLLHEVHPREVGLDAGELRREVEA
jgi:phosphoglycerate dehydrogenase-like enzyme